MLMIDNNFFRRFETIQVDSKNMRSPMFYFTIFARKIQITVLPT